MTQLRCFSSGGGVQSTAALVLSARREIDFPIHLFSNVGDDSEHPATLDYVRNVAMPYAKARGIELIELRRIRKATGEVRTLYGDMPQRVPIPIRLTGGAPGQRNCTEDYKVLVISREVKRRGASKEMPATVGMGISLDEYQRMRSDDPRYPHIHKAYPLIDLRLSRQDCINIIHEAGLPVPPRSSCYFCPFKTLKQWRHMKEHEIALFDKAVALEQNINARRAALGRDDVYLSSALKPLDQAVAGTQHEMDFGDTCESGFCHT